MRGSRAAICALEDYTDAQVETHVGKTLGGDAEDPAKCLLCGSYNFPEERNGDEKHFNICCRNGKISPLQLRPFAPPPPELQGILEGRSGAMRRARART